MKPVHVVILLFAGALSGSLLMRFVHQEKQEAPVAATVPLPPLPPAPAAPDVTDSPIRAIEDSPAPATATAPQPSQPPAAVPTPQKPSPMPPPVVAAASAPKATRPRVLVPAPVAPAAPVAVPPGPAVTPPPASPTVAAEPEPAVAPPPPSQEPSPALPPALPQPPEPHQVTLNAGLLLPVRLVDSLSSERNAAGDTFAATLDRELVADGFVVAERGARVEGRVIAVDRAKPRGNAALAVELTTLHTSDGQAVPILTDDYFKHADRGPLDNTTKIAGGALLGAAIGAIAGGGKGAAIGAGVGGGAGAGDVLLAKGKPAELASETLVTFKLKTPVPLTERAQ